MNNAGSGVQGPWSRGASTDSVLSPQSTALSGFTLIEVLLALAILAIVMTTIYGSFGTASRNIERAEEVRDGTDRARTLIARITTDLSNAYFVPNSPDTFQTFFLGKKFQTEDEKKRRYDSVNLTTLTNTRKADTKEMSLWEVGYFFQDKPDGSGRLLTRREKRVLDKASPPLEGGADPFSLTDTVDIMQIRYYNGTIWVDDWTRKVCRDCPKPLRLLWSWRTAGSTRPRWTWGIQTECCRGNTKPMRRVADFP